MTRTRTGRAGLRHVIKRDPSQKAEQDVAPEQAWSEAEGLLSPGERWLGAVLRGPGWVPVWVRQRVWEAHPEAVREVRALTWAALADWNLLELTDDAMLCASELATNAIVHAGMPDHQAGWVRRSFTVRLSFWPRRAVAIEVRDGDPRPPVVPGRWVLEPSAAAPERIGGSLRGLRMVEAVSDLVSWSPVGTGGKTVWCRFDLEPRGLARPFTMTGNR
ncbi:ATP-binding protein [Embleya scabrispora]|nr:ATP-binding protein [Embleya scabrispora]